MEENKRDFSLSIWDHKDNFICLLKSSNSDFEGQSYGEDIIENINGQETLTFSLPIYVFDNEELEFKQNKAWQYILNEQKIRYTEYDSIDNTVKNIKEFVIKNFTESRNGEEKIVQCECEPLAVYELSKVGWNITFDVDYISNYESSSTTNPDYDNLLTIDYWMKKILYYESNLGRVSNTTECTYLLRGIQLRDEEGAPIANSYISDSTGAISYSTIVEPTCRMTLSQLQQSEYYNPTGWYWEVQSAYINNPNEVSITTNLYEKPVIDRYIQTTIGNYQGLSKQRKIGTTTEQYLRYPIEKKDGKYEYEYVTDIKKRLFNAERSNIYSIIQDLCETFEVWAKFIYNYNEQGKIIDRKILFKTEAINENINFDFAYGKNLQSCSRTADSNDLITKLIVTDTESQVSEGNILSIKQSTANPTGEGYLYNFDYFYDLGVLSRYTNDEKLAKVNVTTHSDEYKINYYYGKLKEYNEKITDLQKHLVPLYDRQMTLEGDKLVQESSLNGYMDNIQSIQDNIDAIPTNEQVVKSWVTKPYENNHVGEHRTISTTVYGPNNEEYYYINFGKDDIIYNKGIEVPTYRIENNEERDELVNSTTLSIPSYLPRIFIYNSWSYNKDNPSSLDDNNTTNFISITTNSTFSDVQPDYSELGDEMFVKGIYFKTVPGTFQTYVRVRYERCPLAYDYLLIKDYWDKILKTEQDISVINTELQEINNKIITKELELNNILNTKKKLIYQFENDYKPYIREGYWEPSDYQPQIQYKVLDTSHTTSIFEGFEEETPYLAEMNLNDSLDNYTYYIDLNIQANEIDIDGIKMRTKSPAMDGYDTIVPRYRGNDFEIFIQESGNVILGISPSLINNYQLHKYNEQLYYKSTVIFTNSVTQEVLNTEIFNWIKINDNNHNPQIAQDFIYLSDDNVMDESIEVYGIVGNKEIKLERDEDYTVLFDYAAYTSNGTRVPLNERTSYSTDLYYDYFTKITLKYTNKVNSIISKRYKVKYSEETTLDFLYNDAVAMSKEYASPKVTYAISVLDLSKLNGYENYKPKLGQKVPIWDIEMGLNGYEGFITSISKELENPENTQLEIATYETRFEDIFQKLTATMTDISYNENSIYTAANSFNTDGTIKTQIFQKALEDNSLRVSLGVNNEITISESTGITLKDKDNNTGIKLIGNGIFLTNDITSDPVTWRTGITGDGINADAIIGGSIDTKKITIWSGDEDQYRFLWNDQGLFAFGDKFNEPNANSRKDLIDYSKYVKFNQNGLDFNDNGKSALSLGWNGLQIQTQNGALTLDADDGLKIKQGTTTKLELGKLDNGSLYGLRLKANDNTITFQNDSEGDLWLHRHIRLGGSINNNIVQNPTAGIYGLQDNVPIEMQMGIRRDDTGTVIWDTTPIRFWAGIQAKNIYQQKLHITDDDVSNSKIDGTGTKTGGNNFYSLTDNVSPSLAKFKVSANGDIIASGIDVGGWIGEGERLHSSDNHAILRSNNYGLNDINPIIAVGKPSNDPHITTGDNYNFRLYKSGKINIGSGNFIVDSNGKVTIKSGSINIGGFKTSDFDANNGYTGEMTNPSGTLGGMSLSGNGMSFSSGDYTTGIYAIANSDSAAIKIGKTDDPAFKVDGMGNVTIKGGSISIGGLSTNSNSYTLNEGSNNKISGFTVNNGGFEITSTVDGVSYKTGAYAYAGNNNNVFQAGPSGTPTFKVNAKGTVTCTDIYITGGNNTNDNVLYIGNGTFSVTKGGVLTATGATITGTIRATSGYIGENSTNGFNITSNAIYNGTNSMNSTTNGIYLGTNGINLAGNFKVANDGTVTIKKGSININNQNFYVDTSGNVKFAGTIEAYYGGWYKGIDSTSFTIQNTGTTYTTFRVVRGLIVGIS